MASDESSRSVVDWCLDSVTSAYLDFMEAASDCSSRVKSALRNTSCSQPYRASCMTDDTCVIVSCLVRVSNADWKWPWRYPTSNTVHARPACPFLPPVYSGSPGAASSGPPPSASARAPPTAGIASSASLPPPASAASSS